MLSLELLPHNMHYKQKGHNWVPTTQSLEEAAPNSGQGAKCQNLWVMSVSTALCGCDDEEYERKERKVSINWTRIPSTGWLLPCSLRDLAGARRAQAHVSYCTDRHCSFVQVLLVLE